MQPDPGRENEAGVQVSRRVWFLHHKDLLDHPAKVQRDRLPAEGTLQRGGPSGAGQGLTAPPALLPPSQRGSGLPEAHRHGLGVPGALSQLLRGGHGDGQHRDKRQTVQRHLDPHRRLQRDVLRPGLQYPPLHAGLAVQLQVPLVLFCQVQHLQ